MDRINSNKSMEVSCNICDEVFTIELQVKTEEGEEDIILTFFQCPKCKQIYPAFWENSKTKELQNLINLKEEEIPQATEVWQKQKLLKELQSLQTRKKKLMEGLHHEMRRKGKTLD